jgi:hypothetical protein
MSNFTLERTGGSRSLAAAAQRERWADKEDGPSDDDSSVHLSSTKT